MINNINKEAKAIAKSLDLDAKIERYADRRTFITIKDHKPNFPHNLKCRLINPAKSEMGIVSKKYLENIIKSVSEVTRVNPIQAGLFWGSEKPGGGLK